MRGRDTTGLLFTLVAALALAGCQPARAPATGSAAEPGASAWPPYDYATAAVRGEPVFRLDPGRSRVEILVGKAGPLARFGHEHVVAVDGLEGWLLLGEPLATSRADLRFPVSELRVDPADARQRHDMDDSMTPEDIEGTRENLMQQVLDAGQWPMARLSLQGFSGRADRVSAELELFVNGSRHTVVLPFDLRVADDAVTVEGRFALDHGDLGLQPYSALGGGLRVAETLEIEFALHGTAVPAHR